MAVCELTAVHRIPAQGAHFPRGVADNHPHASYPVILPPDRDSPERAFGDYAPGRYAWLLTNVRALPEPVPCRGYQQLWDVPIEVAASIASALGE